MDWYKIVFELIDLRSFSNLWYWIMLGVVWSMASHWVLGVPFDMIVRARRHGGQTQQDLETLVRINTQRMLFITRTAGLWLVTVGCFVISVLAVLGFWYGIEFSQALLLLLFPLMLLLALSLRQARLIEAGAGLGIARERRRRRQQQRCQQSQDRPQTFPEQDPVTPFFPWAVPHGTPWRATGCCLQPTRFS